MGLGPVTVSSGLLHDTVEDSAASLDDLEEYFGEEVADVVNGVTKIGQLVFGDRQTQQAEYIRKMILSMSHDIRVLLVKLADRVHNMRTLGIMEPAKQKRIARETLDIYAPLAGRLGMFRLKAELEDLSFFYLEPEAYQQIQEGLARKKGALEKYNKDMCQFLREKLEEHHIKGEVNGRVKNFYSIYRKLQAQQITLDELYDLLAFRIIVETVHECYETLGVIHNIFRPVPGRLKDYIGMPKANMYQSMHTTVIGQGGERLEIQIRTREMHRVAEEGIAAHWSYKERRAYHEKDAKRFTWLKQMVDLQKELKNPQELLEGVRLELYPDEVYAFTPTGDVKELPRGATLVDFAYAIHSEVGDRCTGAKVNGRMVPLRTELQNGDTVEIITSPHHNPSRDWLQFVKTTKARHKIRQWLKVAEREQSVALGKELLERELRKSGASLQKLMKEGDDLKQVIQDMSFVGVDDLLAAIGHGKVSPGQVTGRLVRLAAPARGGGHLRSSAQTGQGGACRPQGQGPGRSPDAAGQLLPAHPRGPHHGLHHPGQGRDHPSGRLSLSGQHRDLSPHSGGVGRGRRREETLPGENSSGDGGQAGAPGRYHQRLEDRRRQRHQGLGGDHRGKQGGGAVHHSGGGPAPPGEGLRRPEAVKRSDFGAANDGVKKAVVSCQ